ncbi:MAG: hypothetical protein ABIO37_17150 [Caulobacteraceae bacterium]
MAKVEGAKVEGAKVGGMVFGGVAALAAAVVLVGAATLHHGRSVDETQAAPRISVQYRQALARLPDWNGPWDMTGGASTEHRLMFDVDHIYYPEDPGGVGMGPMAGAQDTAIPLNPKYAKVYSEILRKTQDGFSPDAVGNCKRPHGMPRQMGGQPNGPTILMAPDHVQMSWGWLGAIRRIYTDGRPHPKGRGPSYMGHSIGRWDGDTLIVDTVGMYADIFDQSGAPHSDKVHLTERLRLVDQDTLENAMTIEDRVMFTEPWKVVRRYKRSANRKPDLTVAYCPPGEDNLEFVNGHQRAVLPAELEARTKSAGAAR